MNRDDILNKARELSSQAKWSIDGNAYWIVPFFQEAYEAGAKAEREQCAQLMDDMAARDKLTNYYKVAALAIRERKS